MPPLTPSPFHACGSCLRSKFHNKALNQKTKQPLDLKENTTDQQTESTTPHDIKIGQFLHMDYGFVRGSDYNAKDNDGKLVTSIGKYCAYLLIIDKKS